MKKILGSILTLGVVAAVAVVATNAFFTDEEKSTGNTFVAGDLDLTIDNTSYLNGVLNEGTSWKIGDLTNQLFFNFKDLKPGDEGEDTISFHVTNNSWLCAEATLTANDDVTCEPNEISGGDPNCDDQVSDTGDLAGQLNFIFWADDGDNVLETDEVSGIFNQGNAADVLDTTWTLSDSSDHNVGGGAGVGPLIVSTTYYVGKAWCFGDLTANGGTAEDPLNADGTENNGSPVERGSGVDCDGSQLNNAAMTDLVKADLVFTATQARNNPGFLCVTPIATPTP